jgi:hypothetical protein
MWIKEIRGGSVLIELDPGTCLALAEACWAGADYADDHKDLTTHAGMFAVLRCLFESLALIGAGKGYGTTIEMSDWSLADVRKNWAFLPDLSNGAK